MDFRVDEATRESLAALRIWGREEVRPVGLEADREARPIPVGHAYFDRCLARGDGRTHWRPEGAPKSGRKTSTLSRLLLAEEFAYWDRGVMIAGPGPGLPELSVISSGTEEQKERFLGPFVEPDRPRWACFAMTEPASWRLLKKKTPRPSSLRSAK